MSFSEQEFSNACETCNIEKIKELCNEFKEYVNFKKEMHVAVKNGNMDVFRCLHECGGNIHNGEFLIEAVKNEFADIVDYLLLNNVDVNNAANCINPPLCIATIRKNVDIVRKLLETQKCDVNAVNMYTQETPLFHAVRSGIVEIVDLLIVYGADYYHKNKYSENLLHIAACRNYPEIIGRLLSLNIDINKQSDPDGQTPLHYASRLGFINNIRLLLDNGSSPDIEDYSGKLPADYF